MSTFNNFTTTVFFSDFSAENWDTLVKDGISTEHMLWDKTEIQMLWNAHQGTSLLLKNYIDQVLNGAINHYNSALTTAYNRIATLEAEVIHLRGELTRLPGGNIVLWEPRVGKDVPHILNIQPKNLQAHNKVERHSKGINKLSHVTRSGDHKNILEEARDHGTLGYSHCSNSISRAAIQRRTPSSSSWTST